MKLDLERQAPGRSRLEVAEDVSLGLPEGEGPGSVRLEGLLTLDNLESRLLLTGTLEGRAQGVCDRCLGACDLAFEVAVELLVIRDAEGAEDEGEAAVIHQRLGEVDLSGPLREACLLALPQKQLCREDCRGLCPACGANRNLEACGCETEETDPRWGGLPTD